MRCAAGSSGITLDQCATLSQAITDVFLPLK